MIQWLGWIAAFLYVTYFTFVASKMKRRLQALADQMDSDVRKLTSEDGAHIDMMVAEGSLGVQHTSNRLKNTSCQELVVLRAIEELCSIINEPTVVQFRGNGLVDVATGPEAEAYGQMIGGKTYVYDKKGPKEV